MHLSNEKRAHLHSHFDRERTYLANERTMLSYVRTCFALIFAGFAILRFFSPTRVNLKVSYILIGAGLATGVAGLVLFEKRRKNYKKISV